MDGRLADEALAALVREARRSTVPARTLGVGALREGSRRRAADRPAGPPLAEVSDRVVPGPAGPLPARLYRSSLLPRPLVVYLHGGGWTLGDLDTHDRVCRRLAREAGATVLAVHLRRAPEWPWPAAVDDAVAALRWAAAQAARLGGRDGTAVAGDSSGGTVAALACLRLRDGGGPLPTGQLLVCPNTDLALSQPSVAEKASGWLLDAEDVRWFAQQWVPDPALRARGDVSPLRAADLGGLPPAVVVTAEHDPLRDEGDAYAERLRAAGVPVEHWCAPGLVHGFVQLDTLSPACARAAGSVYAAARRLLWRQGCALAPG